VKKETLKRENLDLIFTFKLSKKSCKSIMMKNDLTIKELWLTVVNRMNLLPQLIVISLNSIVEFAVRNWRLFAWLLLEVS